MNEGRFVRMIKGHTKDLGGDLILEKAIGVQAPKAIVVRNDFDVLRGFSTKERKHWINELVY